MLGGACSNLDELLTAVEQTKGVIVMIITQLAALRANRAKRLDDPGKMATCGHDIEE